MKKVFVIFLIIKAVFLAIFVVMAISCKKETAEEKPGLYGIYIDTIDGAVYRTLQLGDQLWLADNINKGEMIDGSLDQKDNGLIEKYCYDNNQVLCGKYGGLYQWGEAMQYSNTESSQGICPAGWHIPSDSEWKILEIYLGMSQEAVDDIFWRGTEQGSMLQPMGGSGFEALRGGNRFITGSFNQIGNSGYFWTSTIAEDGHAWRRGVNLAEDGIYRSVNNISFGFTVRCLRY